MKFVGDYHTHTIYSHGKGDIIDNAREAKKRGLKQIAITDHGFGHLLYGVNRKKLPEMREKIKQAEAETGVKILLGVEANFCSTKGDVDVTEEDLKNLDILLVGHHRFVKSSLADKFKFFIPNMIFKNHPSKKLLERNTAVILQALDKYPINILTHLNYEMRVDIEAVAKKAVEKGTLIELNERKMMFTQDEIDLMVGLGVKFVVNSDAHRPERVGDFTNATAFIQKFNIPKENIVNLS